MSLFGQTGTSSGGGGLFGANAGSTAAAPASGGLFGSTPASTAPASGGLFGSTPASQPAPTGGLFGNAAANAPKPGGLFGASTTPSQPAPSGGLFGAAPAQQQPQQQQGLGGSLFGGSTAQQPQQNAPSGGLFGGASTQPQQQNQSGGLLGNTQQQPATGGGLFGSAPAQPQQNAGGLFGSSTAQPQQNTGGMFSSLTAQPQQNTGGMFGASTAQPQQQNQGGLFGSTTTQQNQQQQQGNQIPAATVDGSRLTPTTRFGDCHSSVQQELENVEKEIQEQITLSRSLADRFPTHRVALETIPVDANVLEHRLATTKSFQTSDQVAYEQVRAHHDADDQASTLSIRNLDLFRLPHSQRSQYIQRASNYSTPQRENEITSNRPMVTYFNKQADEFERKLDVISRSVREVEDSLKSVEEQAAEGAAGLGIGGGDLTAVTGGVGGRQDAKRLNRTLREFNEALKDVSGRIVDTREGLVALTGR
ncbi:hypothetical protein EDC01DRAFT_354305 [Geopyxis carbonaria]|nr:hypothetical protein EDC01DRAFT_354305 [Geopyxis carbonaria]